MIAFLTSSLGGSYQVNGKRYPTYILSDNGLTEHLKKYWKDDSNVLIISAFPEEIERNDSMRGIFQEALTMSGFSVGSVHMWDYRNEAIPLQLNRYDIVLLAGGHVPTQNAFFRKIQLKRCFSEFKGLLISWSAGSMNCAETVYAIPEIEGEGTDESYERFISGLGITKRMIIPHFQDVKSDVVDGMRVIEDMAYPDSMNREFIALNDGSYIVSQNGIETLYGEAYLIKNGTITQLCGQNEMRVLSNGGER